MEERLNAAREQLFVGREAELATIASLLEPDAALRFLYFEGPGGIGKTELLHAASRVARTRGYDVRWVDGRSRLWDEHELAEYIGAGCTSERPSFVALDGFETLTTLEDAVRTRILPSLPDSTRVLGAGRTRLSPSWSVDAGWQRAARAHRVGPISFEAARSYLQRRGVAPHLIANLADEARGLPLALALLADSCAHATDESLRLDTQLPVVEALVDQWLAGLPHDIVIGVQACAIALYATEELLAEILDVPDARPTFDELRRRAFVDAHPHGLVLHDIVRSAVLADLKWRHPERRAMFLQRGARHILKRWPQATKPSPVENRRIVHMMCQADGYPGTPCHRDDLFCDAAAPADFAVVDEICLDLEGPESLHWLQYWRERGSHTTVCRTQDGRVVGFQARLAMDHVSWEDARHDPGTRALWQRWEANGLRRQGKCGYFRHWMGADDHQYVSAVQNELFFSIARGLFTNWDAGIATTVYDAAYWKRFEVAGITPEQFPDLEFECDGHRQGIQTLEMVERNGLDVLRRMFEFMLGMTESPPPEPSVSLDSHGFRDAVRQALRLADRVDLLGGSPLCRVLLPPTDASAATLGQQLRTLMRAECDQLFSAPRDRDIHRAMVCTYFEPIGKQEVVAAELGLSFGTYRRHVGTGMRRLVDALWLRHTRTAT